MAEENLILIRSVLKIHCRNYTVNFYFFRLLSKFENMGFLWLYLHKVGLMKHFLKNRNIIIWNGLLIEIMRFGGVYGGFYIHIP